MVIAEISEGGSSPRFQTSLLNGSFGYIKANGYAEETTVRKPQIGDHSIGPLAIASPSRVP